MERIIALDQSLFYWLNVTLHIPSIDWLMVFCSKIGNNGLFWCLVAMVLFLFRNRLGGFHPPIMLFIGIGIASVIETLLKTSIARPRPPSIEENILQFIELPVSHSFPSGHTTVSFVSVYILHRFFPRSIYWTLPCALLISLSRIYVGVHYPLDIMAGAALGLTVGMIAMRLPVMHIVARIFPVRR